jgi:dipeptidase
MGGDMVVALGRATVDGHTLFGHNSGLPSGEGQALCLTPARRHASGEKVQTQFLELPQARETFRVLGSQARGRWGYQHGVNEHGVAAGVVPLWTRLSCDRPGLTGPDLVRLVLERCSSSAGAMQLLTDLICRHGQGAFPGCPEWAGCDHAFLLADARECFAVEAGGGCWVCQEVQEIRALGGLCTVRQDWDHISPGLSGKVIDAGWWPGDGSKLDFAGAVGTGDADAALRRWGRTMLLLGQQNGHIDVGPVRRLLGDHYEGCADEVDPRLPDAGPAPLCRHGWAKVETAASLVVSLGGERPCLPVAWCAFGPPCLSVYFPVFLDGDLPPAFTVRDGEDCPAAQAARLRSHLAGHPEQWDAVRESLGQLQTRFDQEAAEFAAETLPLKQEGAGEELARRVGLFGQHCLEEHHAVLSGLLAWRREVSGVRRDLVVSR